MVDYSNLYGTIPTYNKNSFMEINQLVVSNEEIIMSLDNFIDTDNEIHYNPDEVTFPTVDNTDDDSIITRIINQIKDGFMDFTREVWLNIKTLFSKVFIPSSPYFQLKFKELETLFYDRFGIFIAPINIFINFIERFLSLSSANTSNFVINVPEYTIPGFDIPILKATSYNLGNVLNNPTINSIWVLYLDFIDCFLIISFLNFTWNKLSSFFGGLSSDNTYYSVDDVDTYDKTTGELVSSRRRYRTTQQERRRNL